VLLLNSAISQQHRLALGAGEVVGHRDGGGADGGGDGMGSCEGDHGGIESQTMSARLHLPMEDAGRRHRLDISWYPAALLMANLAQRPLDTHRSYMEMKSDLTRVGDGSMLCTAFLTRDWSRHTASK
jgi:hypothetical protein